MDPKGSLPSQKQYGSNYNRHEIPASERDEESVGPGDVVFGRRDGRG